MDAKALAKSKRAHSLHLNKKHNPHHASKGSSAASATSSSDKKNPTGKQVKEKPTSKLPSNWDRYEEEYGSDSESVPQEGASKASDVITRKSKGAHYGDLLSEAKAQFQFSSESVSLCDDDVLDEFYQGLGSLLSAKGESKLSWIAEDNFAMEDKAPPPTKASFLSLDLHALSEQLAKASLAERLFIGPDLLPLELCTEGSQAAAEDNNSSVASSKTSTADKDSNSLTSSSVHEGSKNMHQFSEFRRLGATTSSNRHPAVVDESSNPSSAFKDEAGQLQRSERNDSLTSASEFNRTSVAKNPSAFKAANAEAELDMLLDSFTEIEILESTNVIDQPSRPSSVAQAATPTPLSVGTSSKHEVSTQPKRDRDLAKPAVPDIGLDDTLDDLLRETSTVTNKNEGSPSNKVNPTTDHTPSASQPVSNTKITDDFDSWFDTL